jgi:hypothetical protein
MALGADFEVGSQELKLVPEYPFSSDTGNTGPVSFDYPSIWAQSEIILAQATDAPTAPVAPSPVPPSPVEPKPKGEGQEPKGPVPLTPGSQPPPPQKTETEDVPEGLRPKAEKPREAALLERGAILLPQGTLQLEPSFEWTRFSTNRVAINGFTIFSAIIIGTLRVDEIDRDILTGALTARYGIIDRVQIETRVPYVYRREVEVRAVGTPSATERTISDHGIGDVEGTLLYQALIGSDVIPDIILRVRGKSRTGRDAFDIATVQISPGETGLVEPPLGNGFWAVTPGANLVWRTDPVVFFVGGGYALNLSRTINGTKINPGDAIELFVGLNLSLNERVSINLSWVDTITFTTSVGGVKQPGSSFNDGRLAFGSSIGVAPNLTITVTAVAGLSDESPDFQFSIGVPFRLQLL